MHVQQSKDLYKVQLQRHAQIGLYFQIEEGVNIILSSAIATLNK